MKTTLVLVLSLLGGALAPAVPFPGPRAGAEEEDTYMEPLDIITKYGYPAEEHIMQTDDGYLLTLHRIPHGRETQSEAFRGPVLVVHGIFSSSVDWIITGTEKGLGYKLADNGYDVWLTNSRGNTYSKAHVSLNPNSAEFWNFSFHEMAKYDTPVEIDYILHETGWKDLFYIGYSQGTTIFTVFNTLHPEYSSKVRGSFLLAPIIYMSHNNSPFMAAISKYQGVIQWIEENLGMNEFAPHSKFISEVGGALCSDSHPNSEDMCTNLLFVACGYDSEQLNTTMLPIFLGHTPAGASTKQVLHYAQMIEPGKFRQFDYGKEGNLREYGQEDPPDYDLMKMTIPTSLYFSQNDLFASEEDIDILASQIAGVLHKKTLISFPQFNHLDYMIATDVVTILYNQLLTDMLSFN